MAIAVNRQDDLDGLFPPPPGLEQYRQAEGARKKTEQSPEGQQGPSAGELLKRSRQGQMDRSLPTTPAPK